MAGWKGYLFAAILPLTFPLVLLARQWRGAAFPIGWLTILALAWLWAVRNITVPVFTSPLRHLPEPEGESFLLGHGPALISRPLGFDVLRWMQTIPNDGLIHFHGFGHFGSSLCPTTPEAVSEVLNAKPYDYQKPAPARRFLSRVLGNGLVVVEGHEHKMQRKSVAPAFQGKHIRDLAPVFWAKSLDFVNAVAGEMSVEKTDDRGRRTGCIELNEIAQRITLDIIGKAGLGRDFNTVVNTEDELAQQYAIILDPKRPVPLLYFLLNLFFPQSFLRMLPWKANRRIGDAAAHLRVICRRLVAEKKEAIAAKSAGHVDILSVLVRSNSFDDDGLVDQLLTFLAAGHETTSSALTWTTYMLSLNPDVQSRVRAEVMAVLARHGDPDEVDAAMLDEMPLVGAVCTEVLRLFPTVPLTVREAIRDTTIGDVVVPKGTHIHLCPWALNRSEALWGPDAGAFNPDRWLHDGKETTQGSAASAYSFSTFLHGPRSCIGQGFARTELKCLVAALVLRFRLELQDPRVAGTRAVEPVGIITIKPRGGMHLRLTELAPPKP